MPKPHATRSTAPPDLSAQPAVASLFRAAVGPVGADYYAAVFARFDTAGRSRPSWNWAAASLTLNWLLFRQLWLAALAWGAGLLLLPLLLLGLGRVVFALPLPVELGLWLSLAVLSVVLPGAWGNALLYAQCQRRIAAALASRPTLEDAWHVLSQRASASRHRLWLALVNVLVAGVVAWVYVSGPDALPRANQASAPVVTPAAVAAPASALKPMSAPVAPAVSAASVAPVALMPQTPASAVSASAPVPAASDLALRQAASSPVSAPAPVSPVLAASGVAKTASAVAATALPAVSVSAGVAAANATDALRNASRHASANYKPVPPASAASAAAVVKQPADAVSAAVAAANTTEALRQALRRTSADDKPVLPAQTASAARATSAVKTAQAASAARVASAVKAVSAAAKPSSGAAAALFFVNVGLFADAANAQRAQAKLVAAGLPAISQVMGSGKGERTRVRAGPFASRAQAQAAVGQIHALQLDAVLAP